MGFYTTILHSKFPYYLLKFTAWVINMILLYMSTINNFYPCIIEYGRSNYTKKMDICYNNTTIKGRKKPRDVRSYRPVAIANILCKLFEKMTNKRLFCYLEISFQPGAGSPNTGWTCPGQPLLR